MGDEAWVCLTLRVGGACFRLARLWSLSAYSSVHACESHFSLDIARRTRCLLARLLSLSDGWSARMCETGLAHTFVFS